jgi:hypothetical protein
VQVSSRVPMISAEGLPRAPAVDPDPACPAANVAELKVLNPATIITLMAGSSSSRTTASARPSAAVLGLPVSSNRGARLALAGAVMDPCSESGRSSGMLQG